MKYKSMEDLRKLSDKEVEDFLKIYWKTDVVVRVMRIVSFI